MIKLVLYGENDKPVKTLTRVSAKWRNLKRATNFNVALAQCTDISECFDELCGIVADVFEPDATFDEIERGARVEDMINCLTSIITEAEKLRALNFHKSATGNANRGPDARTTAE